MKNLICCLLVSLLLAPLEARDLTVAEQAGKIKLGAKVEVTLQSDEVLTGRRGAFSTAGFSLEPAKAGAGAARPLEFKTSNGCAKPD